MRTKQEIETIIERIRDLDALDIVTDFRAYCADRVAGTYAACRLNPQTGGVYFVNEPSPCCSAEEYFQEEGALSKCTLLSCTIPCESPSPNDGFEWDYCDPEDAEYFHPPRSPDDWEHIDSSDKVAAEEFDKLDYEKCSTVKGLRTEMDEDGDVVYHLDDHLLFLESLGYEFFTVSKRPVDRWVPDGRSDYDVKEVQQTLDTLIEEIEEEFEEVLLEQDEQDEEEVEP